MKSTHEFNFSFEIVEVLLFGQLLSRLGLGRGSRAIGFLLASLQKKKGPFKLAIQEDASDLPFYRPNSECMQEHKIYMSIAFERPKNNLKKMEERELK